MAAIDIFGRKQRHRRLGRNKNKKRWWLSTPFLFVLVIVLMVVLYTSLVVNVAVNNPDLIGATKEKKIESSINRPNVRSAQTKDENSAVQKKPSKTDIIKPNVVRLETREINDSKGASKKGPRGKKSDKGQKTQASPKQVSPRGRKGDDDSPKTRKSKSAVSAKMSDVIPPRPMVDIPKEQLMREVKRPQWMPKPKGHGVEPQLIVPPGGKEADTEKESEDEEGIEKHPDPEYVLKAFVEPIDFKEWEEKPLPVRKTATKDQLYELTYPKLNSCRKVPEKIPVDEYPDQDTFLPWVHDVFPTHDGKYIQFIAQNRRRCHTGNTPEEIETLHLTQPNVALFQHVPVKRVQEDGETRYKLTSHEDADPDGVATRFICRFKPSMEETLSVFNFDYDYAAWRKKAAAHTFLYEDGGIKSVHLSQFIFRCPVPESLVETIKAGKHVENDWSSLFVDIIPIRTPPRYGFSNEFLQPRYHESLPAKVEDRFDPQAEWGENHTLPRIEDSGRWENFPICKTSLQEYYSEEEQSKAVAVPDNEKNTGNTEIAPKVHRLVACMWASAGYTTRGERFAINDGQRRMLEWIHFNKMLGFEHFYLYDNSYAFSKDVTLKPIADLFPDEITYIKWPFNVCNNNPNNVDSPGERSSQYAAESSCRLRFGPHVEWIGQFDIDEYLIPMGDYTSVLPILDKLEEEGKKILSFGSWRAWPRRDLIEYVSFCVSCLKKENVSVIPNSLFFSMYLAMQGASSNTRQ